GDHHRERLALPPAPRRSAGVSSRAGPRGAPFADYGGNRQLMSTGNLAANDRVALFLMDYPRRERLKILGHARVHDAHERPDLAQQAHTLGIAAAPERIFVVNVL